jgi:hypothetical protein
MKNPAIKSCADFREVAPTKQRLHVRSSTPLVSLGAQWIAHLTRALQNGKPDASKQEKATSNSISSKLSQSSAMNSTKKLEQTQAKKGSEPSLKILHPNGAGEKQIAAASKGKSKETTQPVLRKTNSLIMDESSVRTDLVMKSHKEKLDTVSTPVKTEEVPSASKSGQLFDSHGSRSGRISSQTFTSKAESRMARALTEAGSPSSISRSASHSVPVQSRASQGGAKQTSFGNKSDSPSSSATSDRKPESPLTRNIGVELRADRTPSGGTSQGMLSRARDKATENTSQNSQMRGVAVDSQQAERSSYAKGFVLTAKTNAPPTIAMEKGRSVEARESSNLVSFGAKKEDAVKSTRASSVRNITVDNDKFGQTHRAQSSISNAREEANRTGSQLPIRQTLQAGSKVALVQRRTSLSSEKTSESQTHMKSGSVVENHKTTQDSKVISSHRFRAEATEQKENIARNDSRYSSLDMRDVKEEVRGSATPKDMRPVSSHADLKTLLLQSGFVTAVAADATPGGQQKAWKIRNAEQSKETRPSSELLKGASSWFDLRISDDIFSRVNSKKSADSPTAREKTSFHAGQNLSTKTPRLATDSTMKSKQANRQTSAPARDGLESSNERSGKDESLPGNSSSQVADKPNKQDFETGALSSRAPYLSLKVEQLKELRALLEQVIRTSQLVQGDDSNDIRFLWASKEWGPIRFEIRQQEQEIVARLEVRQPEVRALLESHRQALQQIFSQQGLHLDRLDIEFSSPYDNTLVRDVKWDEPRRHREQARDYLESDASVLKESLALEPAPQEREATGRVWIA